MQIKLFLDRRQVDHPDLAHLFDIVWVIDAGRLHRLAGALHGAADPGFAYEHVMRFFGQHETASARERIEAGLRLRLELHLAVTVDEKSEHEE